MVTAVARLVRVTALELRLFDGDDDNEGGTWHLEGHADQAVPGTGNGQGRADAYAADGCCGCSREQPGQENRQLEPRASIDEYAQALRRRGKRCLDEYGVA